MPPLIRQDDLLVRLVKDVNDIRSALRRVVANIPLYDISNENTPDQIKGDTNNYVPGNFDVLRLNTNAPKTITGFTGGVKGRFLRIFNVGSYEITLSHLSASSAVANQVKSATGFDIILNAGGQIVLYYDITLAKWISAYASNADRISCQLRLSADYTLPDGVFYYVVWGTAVKDTGSFWNAALPDRITIPETGWYNFNIQIGMSNDGSMNDRWVYLVDQRDFVAADGRPGLNDPQPSYINLNRPQYRIKGDYLQVLLMSLQPDPGGTTLYKQSPNSVWTEFNVTKM